MDIRYLQRTSGGSYLISLPKEWVKDNGLKKGSQVGLTRLDCGTIMVDSNPLERPRQREVQVDMSEDIGRELTAYYLSGYDRILIKAKTMVTTAQKQMIKVAASRLAGMEVINETSDSLLLVNLVVPVDLSVEDVMKRMHQIGSSMLEDAIAALVEGDRSLAENVVERDDALDRLYFLVIRLLRSAVNDLRMAEKMGILPAQCLDLRFAASMMEKIGDNSVNMSSFLLEGSSKVLLPKSTMELSEEMSKQYERATRALLKGDFELSNRVTKNRVGMREMLSRLGQELPSAPGARNALDIVEDAADHIFDIADAVTER